MRENSVGTNGTESPSGKSERSKGQLSTTLLKMTRKIWRTEPFGPTRRRRSAVDWKKDPVVVHPGAAENVMPRSTFPEIFTEERKDPRMGRGSKDQEEGT